MAGKQSSEVKRRTASTRKTTTTRKSSAGKKRNTSGKSANTKVSRMQVSEYTEPVGDEIKLIIILAVSILILLSVFGLGGRVGDKAAYLFFGLFGFVAYALPFLLFIGSAFHISNRGSRLARIKLTAATVFLIMIMALMALADSSFDGTASVLDGFLNSAAAHNGGGLIGFSLSWVLFNAFGRAGSTVILVCLMLVSGVLITGKRIFIRLGTLIGHMMNDMGQHFNAWREKQARERLARMEAKAAVDSGVCVVAKRAGVIERSTSKEITIRYDDNGEKETYKLLKFQRSNQSNCYNQRSIVFKGDHVEAGEVIADGASTSNGEIALGKNPLIGFMTWEGYNYEDAVLLSERLVQDDVYTSIHIEEYETEARDTKLGPEEITNDVPGVGDEARKDLDERGIIRIGAEVRAGDILVGKVTPKGETELTPEERLLRAIFGEKAREVRDTSLKVPHGEQGIIVDAKVFKRENGDELAPGVNESVRIYIAQKRKISVGDKMAGRHGNKGVVSRVLPVEDMPFLPNGRPLDIVLNPLGVPSRMNIGQVLEIHLSLAAKVLGFNIATPVFDGADEYDIMDTLEMANDYANTEWEDFQAKYQDKLNPEVMEYLGEHLDHREEWKGVPIARDGKVRLRDGRTGDYFDNPVTIGFMHYLKLHHLVDDKIHARSTGPYSLVTQQPLGGKAQFGGQRFGEMEVWALEAYGASYTLQEILTVKSDDVVGRVKTYEAIIKGENIPQPGIPESFKVLIKELQSLALDVKVLDENDNEVELKESIDYGETNFNAILNDNKNYSQKKEDSQSFEQAGYSTQEFVGEELQTVDAQGNVVEDGMDE